MNGWCVWCTKICCLNETIFFYFQFIFIFMNEWCVWCTKIYCLKMYRPNRDNAGQCHSLSFGTMPSDGLIISEYSLDEWTRHWIMAQTRQTPERMAYTSDGVSPNNAWKLDFQNSSMMMLDEKYSIFFVYYIYYLNTSSNSYPPRQVP